MGSFYIKHGNRLFLVEPISKNAQRNANWKKGLKDLPEGGAIHPDDSIISDENFKNIKTLSKGESPFTYIEKLIKNGN